MPMTMAAGVLMRLTSGRDKRRRNWLRIPFFSRIVCQAMVVNREFIHMGRTKSRNRSEPFPRFFSVRIRQSG